MSTGRNRLLTSLHNQRKSDFNLLFYNMKKEH